MDREKRACSLRHVFWKGEFNVHVWAHGVEHLLQVFERTRIRAHSFVDHPVEDVQKSRVLVEGVPGVAWSLLFGEEDLSAQGAGLVRLFAPVAILPDQVRSKMKTRFLLVVLDGFLEPVDVDVAHLVLETAGSKQVLHEALVLENELPLRTWPEDSLAISALLQDPSATAACLGQSLFVSGSACSMLWRKLLGRWHDHRIRFRACPSAFHRPSEG